MALKKITTVDAAESVSSSANLYVEDSGAFKRITPAQAKGLLGVDELKSAIRAVGEIPLVTYDGFISGNGGIGNDDNLYLHTGKIPVEAGDVIGVQIHYTETKKLWLAYATYNAAGTFVARTVLVNQNYTDYSGQFTVPSGASYVVVTYPGYGISTATIQRFAAEKNAVENTEAIDVSKLITNVGAYDCEVGSVYNGNNLASTTRCRTVGYIPVEPGAVFRIKSGAQNSFAVSTYNANKIFITDPGWIGGKYTVNADTSYVRITMRRPDNSAIAAEDVHDIAESIEYIRPDLWGTIEALDDYVPSATNEVGIVSKISDFDCEVGTIYNGINSDATTRCRTVGYVPFNTGRIIVNGANTYVANCYDRERRYIGRVPSDGVWSNANADINIVGTCYIRVAMAKLGNGTITDADVADVAGSFQIVRDMVAECFMEEPGIPSYFSAEVTDCRSKLDSYCTEKALVFAIVTDTHVYYDNKNVSIGWWHDTIRNIKAVNDAYQIDSLVHLGDMVNGSLPKATTLELIRGIRDDMRGIVQPNFILVGNHDLNTFYDNMSEPISEAEMYAVFERYNEKDVTARPGAKPYWYKDYDSFGIRVIFLSASMGDGTHGGLAENWGYPQEEITWFTNDALNTDKQILMLSHMPLSQGYISGDASLPHNGNTMKAAVDAFIASGGKVCGLVNGHTHFDYVHNNGTFYEISHGAEVNTGNTANKFGTEIANYVPESAVQYGRTYGTLTQDLWSVLVIRPTSRTCKLIRFGAGEDVSWSY